MGYRDIKKPDHGKNSHDPAALVCPRFLIHRRRGEAKDSDRLRELHFLPEGVMLFLCDQAARGPDLIAAAVPFGNKTAEGEFDELTSIQELYMQVQSQLALAFQQTVLL